MTLALLWFKGLLARHPARLVGAMFGVALTVALLASIGAFIAGSAASMTKRAIAAVPVDWQIQLNPGTDPQKVVAAITKATAYTALEQVGYADVVSLSATVGGTTQSTGAGKVLGLSPRYRQLFPAQLRPLIGPLDGVLVAQQTAANLHVTLGDSVTIERQGLPTVTVQVAGVADLPNSDSLFQAIGVPPGSAPQAPPDNVLILPAAQWHQLFDPQATAHPDSIYTQLHVQIAHTLPSSPGAAYTYVQALAHNVEAQIAGSATVGDNLAAQLDAARADALYAQVLFLFLGLPGIALGVLLTMAVAASGATRRRLEQALLRTRGTSIAQIIRLASSEALIVGGGGIALGVLLAYLAATFVAPAGAMQSTTSLWWTLAAALTGLVVALVAVLVPAWSQARSNTVASARAIVGRGVTPLWQRIYLDVILLIIAAVVFWRTASTGYQVVLAPEGVAASSVAYETFLAPLCLWLGGALLAMRLWRGGLLRGRAALTALLRPIAHGLAGMVAAALQRQRALITRGVVLVALAFSFAISTAAFNTTYNAQSRVDAQLTNGADVTVTAPAAAGLETRLAQLKALPGAGSVVAMQHRFAYVGNDLQDIFGIDAVHIGAATTMSNAFFGSGNAPATLQALAATPDGVLVAAETVKDFQLMPGDILNLRLQNARDHQYHMIPFHFIGIVREFPTAPKDSFLVANASYIAQQTGSAAAEVILMQAKSDPTALASSARTVVASLSGSKVSDLGTTQRAISSSLTAVDLHGLTQLELLFAVLLVAAATGLIMALGLAERRRIFAVLQALGAKRGQLGAFLWSEGLLILAGGALIGTVIGFGVAQMLVKLLTNVFDPPPEALAIPWTYLVVVAAAAIASTIVAILSAQATARRPVVEALRDI